MLRGARRGSPLGLDGRTLADCAPQPRRRILLELVEAPRPRRHVNSHLLGARWCSRSAAFASARTWFTRVQDRPRISAISS
jgi:hypothetical protein